MKRKFINILNLTIEGWMNIKPSTKKDYWSEHINNPELSLLEHLIDEHPDIVNEEEINLELSKLKREQRSEHKKKNEKEKEELYLCIEELEMKMCEDNKQFLEEKTLVGERCKVLEEKISQLEKENIVLKGVIITSKEEMKKLTQENVQLVDESKKVTMVPDKNGSLIEKFEIMMKNSLSSIQENIQLSYENKNMKEKMEKLTRENTRLALKNKNMKENEKNLRNEIETIKREKDEKMLRQETFELTMQFITKFV
jgi:chromosome segregation ATPase